jgi:thymidylate synthase
MTSFIFKRIYNTLYALGSECAPRGFKILELENYAYEIAPYTRFINFESRKLNIDYIKQEFLWYLRGDRLDKSICDHAKIWKEIVNEDGSINSNYGQYIFGNINQFDTVVDTLKKDKDSRRASIVILTKEHLQSNTKDVPCTYSINFRIRENKLNMSVHMRSQDAIYGMGNDLPCFSFIHEMMFETLRETYIDLEYGKYHHIADSFHIYERHFDMIKKIVSNDVFTDVVIPRINGKAEVDFLRGLHYDNIPENFMFTKWLLSI